MTERRQKLVGYKQYRVLCWLHSSWPRAVNARTIRGNVREHHGKDTERGVVERLLKWGLVECVHHFAHECPSGACDVRITEAGMDASLSKPGRRAQSAATSLRPEGGSRCGLPR
jgi:hypothetical protein